MENEKRVVLNREEFPGNTKKAKAVERPTVQKIATAKRVKKPFHKRFAHAFFDSESGSDVANFIVYDVIIPAAKTTLADLVEGAIDMVLFGGEGSSRHRSPHVARNKGRSYVSYNSLYSGQRDVRGSGRPLRSSAVEPARVNRHDFSSIVFGSRSEAEIVLGELAELIAQYGSASVSDFYDMCGITTDYTDNKYGWFDLINVGTIRVRDGWAIDLPRPNLVE